MKKNLSLKLLFTLLLSFSLAYASEDVVNGRIQDEFEVTQYDGVPAPSTAPTNTARLYYDVSAVKLMLSVNGGAYSAIGGGGGSMTWPSSAGIALYNGSQGWGNSITDNSATWNTALQSVTADSPLSGAGTSASHLVISTLGTWSGNAATATTATNATNITTTDDTTTNSDYYPTFQTGTAGTNPLKTSSTQLTFHPSTGLLTTKGLTVTNKITGSISGNADGSSATSTTATNANNVATTATTTSASYYPLFVSSSSNGNQAPYLSTGFSVNPNTNAVTATTFIGALTGTASGNLTSAAIGSTIQAYYLNLGSIGALANASGWLHNDGAGAFAYSTPTYSQVGADVAGAAAAVTATTLGLVIGTNVQAYNSNLTAINQALTTTSSPSFTAVGATTFTGALTGTASGNLTSSVATLASLTSANGSTIPASDTLVGRATTDTLTNKRITKRADVQTSTNTITPEISTYDIFIRTAQAHDLVINNHSSSTPVDGNMMLFEILSDAAPRAISYGNMYVAKAGIALPTTTVASKNLTMLFIWRQDLTQWVLLATGQEA